MMLSIKRILLFFIIISSTIVFSQENKGNIGYGESVFSAFDSKEKTLQFVSESYLNAKKDIPNKNSVHSAGLNIQQIGNYNDLNINMRGEYVRVDIIQKGDSNQLEIDKEANSIKQKIVQVGQNNSIIDLSIYANNNVNMELTQQGNNQNIQNFGSNSISENMKVLQSGNGASAIIINHK
jgi:minor curlin subunit